MTKLAYFSLLGMRMADRRRTKPQSLSVTMYKQQAYIENRPKDRKAFPMSGLVFFLIPIALAATALILGVGIYSLAKGGSFAKENSNKLMRMRIVAQAVAIAVMMLFLWLVSKGGA